MIDWKNRPTREKATAIKLRKCVTGLLNRETKGPGTTDPKFSSCLGGYLVFIF